MKHAVAALAAVWYSRHARKTEAGLPASSLEVSDDEDNTTTETGSNDTVPTPAPPVHTGFTMEQAQTQSNAAMAEVQPTPTPLSALHQVRSSVPSTMPAMPIGIFKRSG